jgi:endonuclease/exonuclease/phosphatase family metal-dependent hydrolase
MEINEIFVKKAVVICLIISVLSIIGGCGSQQQIANPGTIQFTPSPSGVIKAMTFNIRVDTFLDGLNSWSTRKGLVFETLANNAADVVGLQEALDHQVRQIQQALPQYDHYAAGRNDGKSKGESCAIFYRKDRFTINDFGTFWFSDTPERSGSKDWGNLWPRICSWVHLTDNETNTGFYVYNVHLDVLSQNSRKKSVELLAKRISERNEHDPFIVMGDFNMDIDNPAMDFLENADSETQYPKMLSVWQSLYPDRPSRGTRNNFLGRPIGPKIDHILISANAQALDIEIDQRSINGRYPSDHFPVIAEILLTNSSKKFRQVTATEKKN